MGLRGSCRRLRGGACLISWVVAITLTLLAPLSQAFLHHHADFLRALVTPTAPAKLTRLMMSAPAQETPSSVRVRFVNTQDGKDVITTALEGENLMKVGDKVGIKIPRACTTGLCGTCTCDLQDPSWSWKEGDKPPGAREGFQTIRACTTMVKVPAGCQEMVVDVYRMKKRKKKGSQEEEDTNPMLRFQGDWESTFREGSKWSVPQFTDLRDQGGMALRQERPTDGLICSTCDGKGKTTCIHCDGKGQVMQSGHQVNCLICKGEKIWFCADCQATGASATMGEAPTGGILTGADPLKPAIALFLIQVVIIIATTRLLAFGLSYLNQPRVIAEVLAGIVLGPSVLGNIPGWIDHLFPPQSLPFLTLIATTGLVLYMFLVGVELDPLTLFRNAKHTVAISVIGICVPFCLGAMASIVLYQHQSETPGRAKPPFTSFLLFTGLAMSITAFPVLARILSDLNLVNTEVGMMTIGSAAIDDAVAWCLLILVISILNANTMLTAVYVFLLVISYGILLLIFLRPFLSKVLDRVSSSASDAFQKTALAVTFVAIFLSAWFTEVAGVHSIFGAFLLGLSVPPHHPFALKVISIIEDFVSIVLLPLYFAASGLRTQISTVNSLDAFLLLVMVLTVATTGKLLGCGFAARCMGLGWREAFTVGTLMNTRGLVELIVLNLGLDAGVIDEKCFTIMVLMALITTFATSPIVSVMYPPSTRKYIKPTTMIAGPQGVELGEGGFRMMVVASRIDEVPGLALLAELIRPDFLSAIRFVDSDDTNISIIMAQNSLSAIKLDSTLQLMHTCAYLAGLPVTTRLKICKSEDFASELCKKAAEQENNVVLLPCRRKVPYLRDYHHKFVSETIAKCKQTLLLFFDQQLGPQFMAHRAVGAQKRVVVLFQGGHNDREVLRIAQRFGQHEDVLLEVFVIQKTVAGGVTGGPTSQLVPVPEDEVALAKFEAETNKKGGPDRVSFRRMEEREFINEIMEEYRTSSPHLLVMGCSEGPTSIIPGDRSKRASVLEGAERVFSKTVIMDLIGRRYARMEMESSLLIVMSRMQEGGARAASQRAGLEPLGVDMELSEDLKTDGV